VKASFVKELKINVDIPRKRKTLNETDAGKDFESFFYIPRKASIYFRLLEKVLR